MCSVTAVKCSCNLPDSVQALHHYLYSMMMHAQVVNAEGAEISLASTAMVTVSAATDAAIGRTV